MIFIMVQTVPMINRNDNKHSVLLPKTQILFKYKETSRETMSS
jgi:hypothetical protein